MVIMIVRKHGSLVGSVGGTLLLFGTFVGVVSFFLAIVASWDKFGTFGAVVTPVGATMVVLA